MGCQATTSPPSPLEVSTEFSNTRPAALCPGSFSSFRNVLKPPCCACQRITITGVTLNQGWREWGASAPAPLQSLLAAEQLWGMFPSLRRVPGWMEPRGPQGPSLVVSAGSPGTTSPPDNDRNKENATTNCSALWLLWVLHWNMDWAEKRKDILNLGNSILFLWPRSHLQWNPYLGFHFWGNQKEKLLSMFTKRIS